MRVLALFFLLAANVFAAGPYGADNGWAISNNGSPLLTLDTATNMVQGGTGWIRIEARLIPGHSSWDDQILAFYDAAVNNARAAGLQVILLIDGGSWGGGQTAWEQNSLERDGGDGCNTYNFNYANQAVVPLVDHFKDRVNVYELWNEPDAWTQSYGVGGTFMYPSNFACLLAQSWTAVHVTHGWGQVVLFSGGVFGHSIGGRYTYGNAGAQYIDDTYAAGVQTGTFTNILNQYGTYPLDAIGQHIYIDQGGLTTADHLRQYLDWVRQAYTKYESAGTAKKTIVTEIGWRTDAVSQSVQAQNLVTAFQTFNETPYLGQAIWFQWKDNPAARLYYGVIDPNNQPKASFKGYLRYESFEGRNPDGSIFQPILDYFSAMGAPVFGNPYDNGGSPWVHSWGSGKAQNFDGGADGNLVIMSSDFGTWEINNLNEMLDAYIAQDGINTLGYPLGNEYHCDGGICQDFELGTLTLPGWMRVRN